MKAWIIPTTLSPGRLIRRGSACWLVALEADNLITRNCPDPLTNVLVPSLFVLWPASIATILSRSAIWQAIVCYGHSTEDAIANRPLRNLKASAFVQTDPLLSTRIGRTLPALALRTLFSLGPNLWHRVPLLRLCSCSLCSPLRDRDQCTAGRGRHDQLGPMRPFSRRRLRR